MYLLLLIATLAIADRGAGTERIHLCQRRRDGNFQPAGAEIRQKYDRGGLGSAWQQTIRVRTHSKEVAHSTIRLIHKNTLAFWTFTIAASATSRKAKSSRAPFSKSPRQKSSSTLATNPKASFPSMSSSMRRAR